MGFYKNESDDTFFPAIYITEDKVLERQTQALRDQGWAVIEIHCKNILASQDPQAGALEIIRAVNLPHKLPDDNYMTWTQEIISDLDWLDLSKGVFVILKDYDVLFTPWNSPDHSEAKWMARHLQTVDDNLRYRHSQFAYGDYDPPYVLYGMEVSQEKLDTVLEFFEGRATIIEDFDKDNPGAEYPPLVEYRHKVVRSWQHKNN
ncbi:hypothetical protein HMPREF0733_10371 [Rothia dentocariosa ATCC 17931]|uniref:Uncharacterized protein n=2 Tax=Rothia dentocariosa TaxID=2047 RepID=E3H022_ROTDC|nr:hypothetical protein [Rothia dentocariosa]ADP39829.1 hypothetical protein HMPREF0733_10371 [Rothia dentocariosa ATCC 17931]WMS30741.1 hypothetical protein RDV56_06450 [Rothia dentocariosa]SUE37391.1 Uncharacterised protein [Rothia dentocariosa]